jgi:hypothetical protein
VFRHGSPIFKDIDLLEGVQRRSTKLISSVKDKSCEERLCNVKLTMLETRRSRDLLEVLKIFKGFDNRDIPDIQSDPVSGRILAIRYPVVFIWYHFLKILHYCTQLKWTKTIF